MRLAKHRIRKRPELVILLALGLALLPATSLGLKGSVLVIPAGRGPAFEPAAQTAEAVVQQLQKKAAGKATVKLGYLRPPLPAASNELERKLALRLKRAFSAYEMMEYERVEKELKLALKIAQEQLKTRAAAEDYLQALHLLAAASLMQGKNDEAFAAMNDAVVFDLNPPSKMKFSPAVQELYEQVKLEPPKSGTLVVASSPPGLVWLNSELMGISPAKYQVREGLYLLRIYRPGYDLLQRWVRVKQLQEKSVAVDLEEDSQPEDESMSKLRDDVLGKTPGPQVSQVMLDAMVTQAIIITGSPACRPNSCQLALHWAQAGKWLRQERATYKGNATPVAVDLLGLKPPPPKPQPAPPQLNASLGIDSACTLDNQCGFELRCIDGRCQEQKSITRTWWFWTLVGVGVTGVALGIALPLTRPEAPVIEVR